MAARLWPADAVAGAPTYPGRALRQTQSPFLAGATTARPLGALSGVRPGTPSSIVTASSTTWTVAPFAGVIDGATAAIAGPYSYSFDTNQTGSVTAAGGSARVDRLDVQVIDPAEGGVAGANPLIQIVYTVGTPALAAAPAQSHPLAQLNVPATGGGSPTVTWVAPYAVAAGGILPVPTGAYPATPSVGQYIDDATLGLLRWSGTAWQRLSSGLIPIIPASISGTGATLGPGGTVTLSSCTSVSVNGAFTSAFDRYIIKSTQFTLASAQYLNIRLRNAGADITTGYGWGTIFNNGVSAAGSNSTVNQSSAPLNLFQATIASFDLELISPAAAGYTSGWLTASAINAAIQMSSGAIFDNKSVPADGFTIFNNAGGTSAAMTGSFRIYAYSNN